MPVISATGEGQAERESKLETSLGNIERPHRKIKSAMIIAQWYSVHLACARACVQSKVAQEQKNI